MSNNIVLPTITANQSCGCDEWSCEICYPDDEPIKPVVKPVQVNAWSKPLNYVTVPQPLAKALNDSNDSVDTWVPPPPAPADGFKVVSHKKKYRSKGGAGMSQKRLQCKECGDYFTYTVKQQQKYRARGWKQPKVCKCCAHKRHQAKKA